MDVGKLDKRVEVYAKSEIKNPLGERDLQYSLLKKIWAEITPLSGANQPYQGETERAAITHKFIIRTNAIAALTNDMYFMYKNQRYNVNYSMPNYKNKDRIEVFCELVIE